MGGAFLVKNLAPLTKLYVPYVITIDATKVDSTLSNFPVMVKADSSNFDMSLLGSDNVYFTLTNGTLLDFEIEYATASERIYHVKIPTISSSSDTQFNLQFDGSGYSNGRNASSVWSNNYELVIHMGNTVFDSTGKNSVDNFGTTPVIGPYGIARNFDGINDYVRVNYNSSIDFTQGNSQTITVYFKYDKNITTSQTLTQRTDFDWGININNNTTIRNHINTNGTIYYPDYQNNLQNNAYDVLHTRSTSNDPILYINSVEPNVVKENDTGGRTTYNDPVYIGAQGDNNTNPPQITGNNLLKGEIKEFRIARELKSISWVKAEYHSLFNTLIKSVVI